MSDLEDDFENELRSEDVITRVNPGLAAKIKNLPKKSLGKTAKAVTPVKIVLYDSSKDDDAAEIELVLTNAATYPNKYEIMSMDKTITPIGSFVIVVIYKEMEPESLEDDEEFEIADLEDSK